MRNSVISFQTGRPSYVAKEHGKILHKSGLKTTEEAKYVHAIGDYHTADLYFKFGTCNFSWMSQ